ncbi:uncharacterized protein CEXT_767711 [Caerostris extrusa]|uniref:Uncharacterized protein n=1 Tax=Caerostris extrusa TaxID=172846 RepID=A0AAV4WL15_CAEEX|nr:uncharacterized protein CEXT_767711 [Caerostris extrusa]
MGMMIKCINISRLNFSNHFILITAKCSDSFLSYPLTYEETDHSSFGLINVDEVRPNYMIPTYQTHVEYNDDLAVEGEPRHPLEQMFVEAFPKDLLAERKMIQGNYKGSDSSSEIKHKKHSYETTKITQEKLRSKHWITIMAVKYHIKNIKKAPQGYKRKLLGKNNSPMSNHEIGNKHYGNKPSVQEYIKEEYKTIPAKGRNNKGGPLQQTEITINQNRWFTKLLKLMKFTEKDQRSIFSTYQGPSSYHGSNSQTHQPSVKSYHGGLNSANHYGTHNEGSGIISSHNSFGRNGAKSNGGYNHGIKSSGISGHGHNAGYHSYKDSGYKNIGGSLHGGALNSGHYRKGNSGPSYSGHYNQPKYPELKSYAYPKHSSHSYHGSGNAGSSKNQHKEFKFWLQKYS